MDDWKIKTTTLLITTIFLVILTNSVFGAEYDYNITDETKTVINHTDTGLGRIIINRIIINKTEYELNEHNQTLNITQHDSIINKHGTPVKLNTILVDENEKFTFSNIKNYTVYNASNNQVIDNITINKINPYYISLRRAEQNSPYINFSNNNFILDNVEIINISLITDYLLTSGDYTEEFFINEKKFSLSFFVTETKSFRLFKSECVNNMRFGSYGEFCNITLFNNGNVPLDISFSVSNYSQQFFLRDFALFTGMNRTESINYDVDYSKNVNNKTVTFCLIHNSEIRKCFNESITFFDSESPEIEDFEIPEFMVEKETILSFRAYDNFNVSNATVRIKGEGGKVIEETNLLNPVKNTFNFSYTPEKSGEYELEISVFDYYGNVNKKKKVINVNKLKAFNFSKNVNFGKSRVKDFGFVNLGELYVDKQVSFKINSFDYNGSWKISIKDSEDKEIFIEDVNQSVSIEESGNYTIGFWGDFLNHYNGVISLAFPEYIDGINKIYFNGEVVNYTILKDFHKEDYLGIEGFVASCETKNRNNNNLCSYECVTSIPCSSADDNLLPVTQAQIDDINKIHNESITQIKRDKTFGFLLAWFFGICFVLVSFFHIFKTRIEPYFLVVRV